MSRPRSKPSARKSSARRSSPSFFAPDEWNSVWYLTFQGSCPSGSEKSSVGWLACSSRARLISAGSEDDRSVRVRGATTARSALVHLRGSAPAASATPKFSMAAWKEVSVRDPPRTSTLKRSTCATAGNTGVPLRVEFTMSRTARGRPSATNRLQTGA